ncbi:substrate-binding domain-containing protein [Rufibacter ruber]|uniref:substrate-binding domain-containing protein n=1 Tax=Rufibacter ruber TaxID=1783499 RepID=UPI000836509A|nr:substrate-binding domain-containing protein [Rufibacter ruber]
MERTKNLLFILYLFPFFLLAGCDSSSNTRTEQSTLRQLKVAFVPKSSEFHYWKNVRSGAVKAAKDLDVKLFWRDPFHEDNVVTQIDLVYSFLEIQVDAIVLAPIDLISLVEPSAAVLNEQKPLVIVNTELGNVDYTSFVGTDNIKLGRTCATQMGKMLKGTGKVLLQRFRKGSITTRQREQAFQETLAKDFPQIEVITSDEYPQAKPGEAVRASLAFLADHPDATGVYTSSEVTTDNMLQAIKQKQLKGKVTFIGTNVNDSIAAGLAQGYVQGLALQDPYQIGYESIEAAVTAAKGKPVKKRIETETYFIQAENLKDPKIKSLLYSSETLP